MDTTHLQKALREYNSLGIDTIPLQAGTKNQPLVSAWEQKSSYRMWRNIPPEFNIAIRCGGAINLAVIDCDDKNKAGTFETVTNWLEGWGYYAGEYPLVQTASGNGRHIYFRLKEPITTGLNYCNLPPNLGMGEFRFSSGAYVVAPPSQVEGVSFYQLLAGEFEHIPLLPKDAVQALLATAGLVETPRTKPHIPRTTAAILHGHWDTDKYNTKSEVEGAAVLGLVNAGHDLNSVTALFNKFPVAGKYRQKIQEGKGAEWLTGVYASVKHKSQHDSPTRQKLSSAIEWAFNTPWPGRTGTTDRDVYIAHCRIAYRAGTSNGYAAGSRALAELAGTSHTTAARATKRLIAFGYLHTLVTAAVDCAALYCLDNFGNGKNDTLPIPPSVRKCNNISEDVFRWGGLNKSGELVWAVLVNGPATVKEIAQQTGRTPRTVRNSINRMTGIVDSLTGEIVDMLETDGQYWYVKPNVDLTLIAQILGTYGTKERQRQRHRREQLAHRRALLNGKIAGSQDR